MGTKNNPGKFDCYENAEPDEPMFILLGRDPSACTLVRLWAKIRKAEGKNVDKVKEALDCAYAMERWAERLGKRSRIFKAEEILASVLIEMRTSDVRALRECMIHQACDWVRAHGPHIPNAEQMKSDLFQMLDRDDGLIEKGDPYKGTSVCEHGNVVGKCSECLGSASPTLTIGEPSAVSQISRESSDDLSMGTINSRDPDVTQVSAALADACHAGGLSEAYYRKADEALKRLAIRLSEKTNHD